MVLREMPSTLIHLYLPTLTPFELQIPKTMSLWGIVYAFSQEDDGSRCGYCSPPGEMSAQASSLHDACLVASILKCEVKR